MKTDSALRAIVDTRMQIQKTRLAYGNRVNALMDGSDKGGAAQMETAIKWYKHFLQTEEGLDKDITAAVRDYPIFPHIVAVHGIGPLFAAKLIAMIDISRSPTTSSLWRFAGYAVIDGERERPTKGVKLSYNVKLKSTCYNIGVSFLRSGSPYRKLYDTKKEFYQNTAVDSDDKKWTDLHCHYAAIRYMNKRFLAHLWLVWRTIEGLDTRAPYVQEKLGHTHIDTPQDYGWPEF